MNAARAGTGTGDAARLTVAIDAMGGDHAPGAIVEGACLAVAEVGCRVLLVGDDAAIRSCLPDGVPDGVEIHATTQVIAMDEEPGVGVRRKKDASVVRAAEAVRDGRAHAMVGAGNTGATMAAALLRYGRIRGAARPAIGVPIPVPFAAPQLLVDGGATVDCAPEWLVQFAHMGRAYARLRLGVDEPTVGLLSNGEEPGKGDDLRKEAHERLGSVPGFIGNVEGSDFMHAGRADVVVADGFTGNVALKSMEAALRSLAGVVFRALDASPEAREAAKVVLPLLLAAAEVYDPDLTGGAVLLGVDGVCVISHGASSARAVVSAVRVAAECVRSGVIGRMQEAVADAG